MLIGTYETISDFATAGSGNARWCIAEKDGKRYFLKQFLGPVQPIPADEPSTELNMHRRARCAAFERRKTALYDELKKVAGDCAVHVSDFFVHNGHYFTASIYIDPVHPTLQSIQNLSSLQRPTVLRSLADCLRKLHACGVVHADLKPEHVIIENEWGTPRVRLIDFDSGFLESFPPDPSANIEVDPVYLAPETYRLMTGKRVKLSRKIDTFALGMLLHLAIAGNLPDFDRERYAYLYACVLDRGKINLSPKLNGSYHSLIKKMLRRNPARRPDDAAICKVLENAF